MIFLDTGGWVALSVPGDKNAAAATRLHKEIGRGVHGAIVTTSLVLDEAATLVRMETDVPAASRLLRAVLEGRSVTVVWTGEADFRAALEKFAQHEDKRWSFTDCASFVVMHELEIATAFTFDHNFEEAGFAILP